MWSAAFKGHFDAVKALLERNAIVDLPDAEGATPLFAAIQNGHNDVLQLLIESGADVNISTEQGMTPLHFAASHGNVDATQVLLESGADPGLMNQRQQLPVDVIGTSVVVPKSDEDLLSSLLALPSDLTEENEGNQTVTMSGAEVTDDGIIKETIRADKSDDGNKLAIALPSTVVGVALLLVAFFALVYQRKRKHAQDGRFENRRRTASHSHAIFAGNGHPKFGGHPSNIGPFQTLYHQPVPSRGGATESFDYPGDRVLRWVQIWEQGLQSHSLEEGGHSFFPGNTTWRISRPTSPEVEAIPAQPNVAPREQSRFKKLSFMWGAVTVDEVSAPSEGTSYTPTTGRFTPRSGGVPDGGTHEHNESVESNASVSGPVAPIPGFVHPNLAFSKLGSSMRQHAVENDEQGLQQSARRLSPILTSTGSSSFNSTEETFGSANACPSTSPGINVYMTADEGVGSSAPGSRGNRSQRKLRVVYKEEKQ